ncbi:MAG: stage III sporulation protein AB [Lachnospiraceae bacterium]|nr:stage III sporulation protein AB [Lachnospiraceae bacterium]
MNRSWIDPAMLLHSGRYLGCLGILTACIGLGILYGKIMHKRQKDLRDLIEILQLFAGELEYGSMLLSEGMILCGNKIGGRIGKWFGSAGYRLSAPDGVSFHTIWKEQLKDLHQISELPGMVLAELDYMGIHLAGSDKQTQLQTIRKVVLRLQEIERQQVVNFPGQIRMITSLSILAGLFLIIILY